MWVIAEPLIRDYVCPQKKIMSVMLILLGASLIVSVIFVVAFIWSVKDGQYDDDFTPAHQIFFDENKKPKS